MRSNGTAETVDDPACVNARPRRRRDPGSIGGKPSSSSLPPCPSSPSTSPTLPVARRRARETRNLLQHGVPYAGRNTRATRQSHRHATRGPYALRAPCCITAIRLYAGVRSFTSLLVCALVRLAIRAHGMYHFDNLASKRRGYYRVRSPRTGSSALSCLFARCYRAFRGSTGSHAAGLCFLLVSVGFFRKLTPWVELENGAGVMVPFGACLANNVSYYCCGSFCH